MSDSTKDAQRAFSLRLKQLMQQRGYTSNTSATGIDITKLAQMAGATYEMARRYTAGEAMPRAGKLAAIAKWLGVQPGELVYGTPRQSGIDEGLLEQCIQAVNETQARTQTRLTPEKTARLVAVLYQEAISGSMPSPHSIDLMSKAMA